MIAGQGEGLHRVHRVHRVAQGTQGCTGYTGLHRVAQGTQGCTGLHRVHTPVRYGCQTGKRVRPGLLICTGLITIRRVMHRVMHRVILDNTPVDTQGAQGTQGFLTKLFTEIN